MECQRCNSVRLAEVSSVTDDTVVEYRGQTYEGHVPTGIGLGDDDDTIEFTYCVNCGQIQGAFPITNEDMLEALEEEDDYDD